MAFEKGALPDLQPRFPFLANADSYRLPQGWAFGSPTSLFLQLSRPITSDNYFGEKAGEIEKDFWSHPTGKGHKIQMLGQRGAVL